MNHTRSHLFLLAIALIVFPIIAYTADISVPELEMITLGRMEDDAFVLRSRIFLDLAIQGGSKFGGALKLNFNSGAIEDALALEKEDFNAAYGAITQSEWDMMVAKINSSTGINFKGASITLRDIFSTPFSTTYFIGDLDTFCSGDDFPTLFGAAPFSTSMRGFAYFPDGIGNNPDLFYDGIHGVSGTGMRVSTTTLEPWLGLYLYAYQDANLGSGKFSTDFRIQLNFDQIKLEAFAGASFPESAYGIYRAGFLFYYSTGMIGDFYAQIGAPWIDPSASLDINQFYFLFEPRLNFDPITIITTLFYHPSHYLQKETNEEGCIDLNFNVLAGGLTKYGMQGGMESLLILRLLGDTEPLNIKLSPYFSTLAGGVIWNFKVNFEVFPWEINPAMISATIGVKAAF